MKLLHWIVAWVALLGACAPVEAGPVATEPATITLTRGVCFGFCPDYTVTIESDGRVSYEGRRFVAVAGRQEARVAPGEVQHLLARFDAIGFMDLRDAYRARVSDLPTYTVTLTRGGVRKQVLDYGGVHAGMPAAVRELQDEIDRVAGVDRWVLRDGEAVRELER